MSLKDLLESGANITVAVKLDDLREILKEAAGSLKPVRQEPPPEEFLSRKEVLSVLRLVYLMVLGKDRVYKVFPVRWTQTV